MGTSLMRTQLADGTLVLTALLSHDHGWFGEPRRYETIAVKGDNWGQPLVQRRYATREEAETGHAAVVQELWQAEA